MPRVRKERRKLWVQATSENVAVGLAIRLKESVIIPRFGLGAEEVRTAEGTIAEIVNDWELLVDFFPAYGGYPGDYWNAFTGEMEVLL